jgi:hypothetical protein
MWPERSSIILARPVARGRLTLDFGLYSTDILQLSPIIVIVRKYRN